jgi:hypothetical protein
MLPFGEIKLLAYIGLAIAALFFWHKFTESLKEEGRQEVRLQVAERDAKAKEAAETERKLHEAQDQIKEHAAQDAQVAAAKAYQDELQRVSNEKDRRIAAAVASGKLYLHQAAAACPGGQPAVLPGGSGAGRSPDAAANRIELPAGDAGFLRNLAGSADADIAKLGAQVKGLQAVVGAYVKLCGPGTSPPPSK